MYKTVRHGDNSLQYKILAQQEEGVAGAKRRRSKRGKAAGILAVVVLLVCGVVATAVLVPLLLTDDFVDLTGTFQKYSVSTLRRTHSGNHIVVIAKKPQGWNGSRQIVSVRTNNVSRNPTKEKLLHKESWKNTTTGTLNNNSVTNPTENEINVTMRYGFNDFYRKTLKLNLTTTTTYAANQAENGLRTGKESSLAKAQQGKTEPGRKAAPADGWVLPSKWFSGSFFDLPKNGIFSNRLTTTATAFFVVSFIVILLVLLTRRIFCKKGKMKKELSTLIEDKTRLLKTSTRGSDED